MAIVVWTTCIVGVADAEAYVVFFSRDRWQRYALPNALMAGRFCQALRAEGWRQAFTAADQRGSRVGFMRPERSGAPDTR